MRRQLRGRCLKVQFVSILRGRMSFGHLQLPSAQILKKPRMAAATPGMNHYEKQLTPTHCTYRFSPFPLKVDETSQNFVCPRLGFVYLVFFGAKPRSFPPYFQIFQANPCRRRDRSRSLDRSRSTCSARCRR